MFKFSQRSTNNMIGLHPALRRVLTRALALGVIDFVVTEGVRTDARQRELYAQGRTTKGKKVTWTLNSKHKKQADGFGHAFDVCPIVNGKVEVDDHAAYVKLGKVMMDAARLERVNLRWGYDWDRDMVLNEKGEYDGPHFELA